MKNINKRIANAKNKWIRPEVIEKPREVKSRVSSISTPDSIRQQRPSSVTPVTSVTASTQNVATGKPAAQQVSNERGPASSINKTPSNNSYKGLLTNTGKGTPFIAQDIKEVPTSKLVLAREVFLEKDKSTIVVRNSDNSQEERITLIDYINIREQISEDLRLDIDELLVNENVNKEILDQLDLSIEKAEFLPPVKTVPDLDSDIQQGIR